MLIHHVKKQKQNKTEMLLWPKVCCFSWIVGTKILLWAKLVTNVTPKVQMFSEHKFPTALFIYCRYSGPWELQCSMGYKKFIKNPPAYTGLKHLHILQLFIHATKTTSLWSQQHSFSWRDIGMTTVPSCFPSITFTACY